MSWFSDWFGRDAERDIDGGLEDAQIAAVGYTQDDLEIAEVVGCEELNEASHCGDTGKVDCVLCEREDPGRFIPGTDVCTDCKNTGLVDCEHCEGRGVILVDGNGYGN